MKILLLFCKLVSGKSRSPTNLGFLRISGNNGTLLIIDFHVLGADYTENVTTQAESVENLNYVLVM